MNYEELLKRAEEKIPKKIKEEDRFKIPEPVIISSGKKTIIKNFNDISNTLRREPKHIAKFFFKEFAIPGYIEDNKLILQQFYNKDVIEKNILNYCSQFVFCNECGKADTKFIKKGKITYLKCEACGAERTVKKI